MYTGKRVTVRTYHIDGDHIDPTDGRRFSEVTTDTRELEPHKAQHKDTLKVVIQELYIIYAPLHKQINASLGLLSEEEQALLIQNMTFIAAEYAARKTDIDAATTCDEVETATHSSYDTLISQLGVL